VLTDVQDPHESGTHGAHAGGVEEHDEVEFVGMVSVAVGEVPVEWAPLAAFEWVGADACGEPNCRPTIAITT
jgi:hypothetical protein